MAKHYAMVIDSSKCIDCRACMLSCKSANNVPHGQWRNWVKASVPDFKSGQKPQGHFQPGGCMHCNQPTCVEACPTGATFKNETDGTVVINQDLCIGCGNCIPSCPYGARYRHPEKKKAEKCDYCAQRRANGLQPACVDTCPTKARVFGDLSDPNSEASRLMAEGGTVVTVENPKTPTQPNMYYLNATAPADWPVEAVTPPSMATMTGVVDPVVKVFTALSGLGVLAMLGRQLLVGSDDNHDDSGDKEDSA